jgi:hypothetical protein
MKRQVLVLVCVNGGPPVSLFFRWGVHECLPTCDYDYLVPSL